MAERPQERGRVELAAALALVHEAPHHVVRVEHHLDPVAAVGDDAHREKRLAVRMHLALGRDAGAAVELRDDDALGAVDDEGAVVGHDGHVAEEDVFLAHRAALGEAERRVKRAHIRLAGHEGLEMGLLGGAEAVADEVERIPAVGRLHGEYLVEDRLEALVLALLRLDVGLQEVLIRLCLYVYEVWHGRSHAAKTSEDLAFCTHCC